MVELSSLRVFLTAAEEKNFSRAAERLHMSQSAVSQNIQGLEQAYGTELFIRCGRTVVLSEAGQAILPMVREVINSARLLEDTLLSVNNRVCGELLIGCSTSAGKYLLPTLLSEFQKQYPAVLPRVKVMSRDGVMERLLNHSIPFGISSRQVEHRDLECEPLFEDRIALIVPPNHPWAEFGHALPSDLLDQSIISREEGSGTYDTVLEGLKHHSITRDMLRVAMELGNAEAIEMAVERGVGIAFVSEMVAASALALNRVKKVEMSGLDLRRTIYIVRHVDCAFTRAQKLFWEFVHAQRGRLNTEIWDSLVNIPVA